MKIKENTLKKKLLPLIFIVLCLLLVIAQIIILCGSRYDGGNILGLLSGILLLISGLIRLFKKD